METCVGAAGKTPLIWDFAKAVQRNTEKWWFWTPTRSINEPGKRHQDLNVKFGKMEKYVLVMSNCNVEGRDLRASGQYVWKSEHGYLPNDKICLAKCTFMSSWLFSMLFCFLSMDLKYIPIQNYIIWKKWTSTWNYNAIWDYAWYFYFLFYLQ